MWISKETYDESGPNIVHRKCFDGISGNTGAQMNVANLVAPPPPPSVPEQEEEEEEEEAPQPVVQQQEVKVEEKKEALKIAKTKACADVNSCILRLSTMINDQGMCTGDPIYCQSCSAALNSFSVVAPQSANDKYNKTWVCEFCNHSNKIIADDEEIPRAPTATYMKEKAPIAKVVSHPMVIFCIGKILHLPVV
jgi:hypothetical protein